MPLITLQDLDYSVGGPLLLERVSLTVEPGERIALIGRNGAGKSTLLKLVAGETTPDSGAVVVGASVKMGYFAQHSMELLDPQKSVLETLRAAFPLATIGSMRSLAGGFGFSGDDVDKPCKVLSGGEKARLVLALMLYDPPNFLVLDEPTNHLDLATKEMLLESLHEFEGTMLFVSHDRQFLARISTRILELTSDGPVPYRGGYLEYVARSGHEAPGLR
jgi:ATPase subunit of ABC transporter with duplicated ATPase domains